VPYGICLVYGQPAVTCSIWYGPRDVAPWMHMYTWSHGLCLTRDTCNVSGTTRTWMRCAWWPMVPWHTTTARQASPQSEGREES
jgi:hypothetical protein